MTTTKLLQSDTFHNFLTKSNSHITMEQADYIKKHMTVSQLKQLNLELQSRKYDQLQLCLLDKVDIDDVNKDRAYVEWHGIRFYSLDVVVDVASEK